MRLAIPGLVDLIRVDDADAINALAEDPRIDRRYEARGPLLNRAILRRIRSSLVLDGTPLPPVSPRADAARQIAQKTNETKFAALGNKVAAADVAALAAYVRGDGAADDAGPLAQGAVGRLFVDAYSADRESWAAAKVLGAAPSNFNPFRMLVWGITGRVAKARALLAARVGNSPTGVHATGVAIHNVVETLERMRALYADASERGRLSVEAAVGRSLVAPRQVLRQPTSSGESSVGAFTPDTLLLLRLQDANAREPGYDTAFMAGHWCRCPARDWVPALYAQVWSAAVGGA